MNAVLLKEADTKGKFPLGPFMLFHNRLCVPQTLWRYMEWACGTACLLVSNSQ
jgi:hypothetical protein